uniref:Uncharacterized protein n=1 Tax=Peronospora matthiolae TaxID=2874970 RepID=A0AAV1TT90_9STRA
MASLELRLLLLLLLLLLLVLMGDLSPLVRWTKQHERSEEAVSVGGWAA